MIIDVVKPVTAVFKTRGDYRQILIGDMHYGNREFRRNYLRKALLYARQNKCRIGLMGDVLESVTPATRLHGHIGQELSIDEQIQMFREDFGHFRDLIDFVLAGNHDYRVFRESGVDNYYWAIVDWIKEKNPDVVYAEPKRGIIAVVKAGDVTYRCYYAHGSYGSTRPEYQINKAFEVWDVDLVAIGHIHRYLPVWKTQFTVVEDEDGKPYLAVRRRWGVRTGCFVGYTEYAEHTFRAIPEVGAPVITFNSKRYNIEIDFPDFDAETEKTEFPRYNAKPLRLKWRKSQKISARAVVDRELVEKLKEVKS